MENANAYQENGDGTQGISLAASRIPKEHPLNTRRKARRCAAWISENFLLEWYKWLREEVPEFIKEYMPEIKESEILGKSFPVLSS